MPFVKLPASFPEYPMILEIGPNAAWLYLCSICYLTRVGASNEWPLSKYTPYRLADFDNEAMAEAIQRLLENGLWLEHKGGYYVQDIAVVSKIWTVKGTS